MLSLFLFLDEPKRDHNHATAAAAATATTTKCAVPHAAAQLADGLSDAKRGPPIRSVPLTATTTTDQPIKQQYAGDDALFVNDDEAAGRLKLGLPRLVLVTARDSHFP